MDIAALPTAPIAIDENRKGSIPPMNKPAITAGSAMLIPSSIIPLCTMKAAKRASVVNAAEPIANPFPIAAVVLPTASNLSVLSLTSDGSSAISAIPPALSDIGPYASTASCIPVLASIPNAAIATPYKPAKKCAPIIARAKIRIGIAVDCIPTPKPAIILVAAPVTDWSVIDFTGDVPVPV